MDRVAVGTSAFMKTKINIQPRRKTLKMRKEENTIETIDSSTHYRQ